jgi:hypothetical protein
MKNREYMMTLDDEHLESAIHYLNEQEFDLADNIIDPVQSVTKWLSTEYDPNDRIWRLIDADNDPEMWED